MPIVQPSSCSVFVQIWVDTQTLQHRENTGIYLIDNNLSHGSSGQGTATLNTNVPQGTHICWSLLSLDPTSDIGLYLQDIGPSEVFGAGRTPQQVTSTTWTGTVKATGHTPYEIRFSIVPPDSPALVTIIRPSLTSH